MRPQICRRHAEGWQRNCRSCCWQRKKILYTGWCHVLSILSSRLLSNMHWSCLNSRRIPNKVVSCANAALEKHPETLRQGWILSEASMSYLLPGCQHDIAMILWSGGCREGGADAGWSLFLVFTDSLGASAGMDKTRCRTVSVPHIRVMEHRALKVFSHPEPRSLSVIEAVLRKHAELTFRLLWCNFVGGTFVLVSESGACSWAVFFGKLPK